MNMNGASSSGTKNDEVSRARRGKAIDFSTLPVDIFTNISSFLTSKEALDICFSCKKLKHLVTAIANVEIKETTDGCPTKKQEFVDSISRFLANHNSVVRKFQLSFCPKEYKNYVLLWLSWVVKNGIEELDLMLYDREYMEIPVSFLTAGTLKVLRLRHCKVHLPSIAGFKSLKSLLLGAMNISDDEMGLICCCESLQHLTLENCFGFEEIKIEDPRCKLETLILDRHCLSLSRLIISSLKTLVIHRRNMNFSFIGSPRIDKLVLSRVVAGGIKQQESENMNANIMNRLENVRSLHLDGWAFECFAKQSMENHQFTNLEVLKLDIHICETNLKELQNLIRKAYGLKTLSISSMIKGDYAEDDAIDIRPSFKIIAASFMNKINIECPRIGSGNKTLQNIDIKYFRGSVEEVNLLYYLLYHFPNLRVLEVTPIRRIDEDRCRFYAKLFSRYPRGSPNVCMLLGSKEVEKAEGA